MVPGWSACLIADLFLGAHEALWMIANMFNSMGAEEGCARMRSHPYNSPLFGARVISQAAGEIPREIRGDGGILKPAF